MNKKIKILIVLLIIILIIVGIVFYFYKKSITNIISMVEPAQSTIHASCLADDEIADYPIDEKSNPVLKVPKEVPTVISVRDKDNNKEKFSLKIDSVSENYHPIELHKCGIYVIKEFNYDPKKTKQDPGYREELWKYDYSGNEKNIVLLAEKPKEFISYFSPDFRVDPIENYVVLERGYLGKDDYAVVIKNLTTKEDAFILSLKDILVKNQDLGGTFGMNEWTNNGKYYWGNIFDGADVLAFFRIEVGTWKWEVFKAPVGTMGGDALNPESGYITYDDGAPWTGDEDFDQMYREQWKKEGKKVHFYLYNLFTKEKTLLATYDDPTYFTKPQWLSNTQLQYEMPNGEKKVYEIK